MKSIYRALSVLLLLAAFIQLLGVGERIVHALWQWYKFNGYSNDGHITMGSSMVYLTYGLSFFLMLVGFCILRISAEHLVSSAARLSIFSLGLGLLALSALLFSPISQLAFR